MRKFSLRVNRLKRVSYGPYSLEQHVPNPNDLVEVKMTPELRKLMYDYYRDRTQEATQLFASTSSKAMIEENKKQMRSLDLSKAKSSEFERRLEFASDSLKGDHEDQDSFRLRSTS